MVIDSRNSDQRNDSQLDCALMDPDGLLTSSLQREDRKRRRRMYWVGVCSTLMLLAAGLMVAVSNPSEASAAAVSDTSEKTREGWKLWRERKLEDAELAFLDAIRLNEKDTAAWNGLGWARNNQGKHTGAIEAFEKCLALHPDHGAAINGIGQSHLAQEHWGKAEEWLLRGSNQYMRSVSKENRSAQTLPAAMFGLVYAQIMTEKYEEAQKWADIILKYRPDDKQIASLRAHAASGDNSKLKAEREEGKKRVRAARAWQSFNRGDNQAAIEGFRAALESNPNDLNATNGLAFALLNSGQVADAKPLFEKCIAGDPKHYGARNGLARCLHAEQKTEEAIEIWTKLCEEVQSVNAATAALAGVYLQREEYEKAIPYLKQMAELKGPQADTWKDKLRSAEERLSAQKKE